ncbi:hypothetical protein [Natronolimnobius baerhuensis]|nr:hypothetical protein [Natronolimnobius baerhuensis]
MTTAQTLRKHLVPSESLNAVYEGELETETSRTPVTLGVTDRRLVGCGEDGTFVDVKHDYLTTIQSTRRATSSFRGVDDRVVMAGGGVMAVLSLCGIVLSAVLAGMGGLSTLGLSVAVIAGTCAAVLAFHHGSRFDLFDAFDGMDQDRPPGRATTATPDGGSERDLESERQKLLLAGGVSAVLATLSFGWLAQSGNVAAVLLVVSALAGLAMAQYGRILENEYDGIDFETQYRKQIEVTTVDGRTFSIWTDPSADLERELGCLTSQRQQFSLESVQYEPR